MVTLGSLRAQQRPGVVTYRPVPQQTAPPPTPRGGKSGGSGGTVDRGRPSQGGFAPGDSLRLIQQLANDPGVQEATQKKAQKQAENQAWDNASFKDKLGVTIGKVLQPMDYLQYPKRAIITGIVELAEALSSNPDDWGHIITDPAQQRAGRSNWEMISGKRGVNPETGKEAGPVGWGGMIEDIPSGPAIGPSWLKIKPGQVADRALGAVMEVMGDPLTHATTGGFQVISPAQRTARAAENLSTAAGTQVDDLERLLSKIGQGEKVSEEEIAQAVSRTSQGLDIADRARQVAETTKPGAKVIPLPRGKLGRAQFAYELRTELPAEVWDKLKDDVAYAVAHGFEQASPELKEAARILPGGLRMYGFRVPGTAVVGKAAGAARAGLAAHAPAKWGELRDPEGLGTALDTLARGKGGDIDTAITRIGHEDISRVATGRVRVLADGIAKKFHAEILKPLRRQGGTAVDDALHAAETVGDTPLNQVFQDLLKTFERVSGKPIDPQFLLDQKTYIPHQLTRPFRRYLRKREAEASVKAFAEETAFMTDDVLDQATAIARKRSLVPNADGTPRVYKLGDRELTITDGSIRDLNQALKDTFPDFKGKFYEDDPEVLVKSYMQMRGKEAGTLAANAVLAADPKAKDIRQIIGEQATLLDARNAAMQRDPTNQLITEGYDPAKATEFAQQHLGAPRGPGQEAVYGPELPNAETWVDTDPMFASKVDPQASFIRRNETLGQGADFREQAQIAQGVADKEARKGLDDLRGTLIEDLKKPWRERSKADLNDMTRRIKNIRNRIGKLVAKDKAAVDEIEAIQGRALLDIEDLSAEVEAAQQAAGEGVSRAEQLALKDMRDRLAELKKVRDEAAAKLETAPQAMRDEAKARLDALMAPVRKAQKELADAEEMAGRTVSPTRLRNAQRVMDDVPEAFATDRARLAKIDETLAGTAVPPVAEAPLVNVDELGSSSDRVSRVLEPHNPDSLYPPRLGKVRPRDGRTIDVQWDDGAVSSFTEEEAAQLRIPPPETPVPRTDAYDTLVANVKQMRDELGRYGDQSVERQMSEAQIQGALEPFGGAHPSPQRMVHEMPTEPLQLPEGMISAAELDPDDIINEARLSVNEALKDLQPANTPPQEWFAATDAVNALSREDWETFLGSVWNKLPRNTVAELESLGYRSIGTRPTGAQELRRVLENYESRLRPGGSFFAEHQARLAGETQQMSEAALRAERRVLAKKFARGGEYSRIVNAEKTLADRAKAEGVAGNLDRLRSRVETARTVAEQQQEAVVRGRFIPAEPEVYPEGLPNAGDPVRKTVRVEGPWEKGKEPPTIQTDEPVMIPEKQTYVAGEGGFGRGEVRTPVIPPLEMTPAEQAAQAAARGARFQGLPGGGRTETEAIGALEAEAVRTEAGQGPVAAAAKAAERRVTALDDEIARGVSGHPLVEAARVQGEESIRQAEEAVSARIAQEGSDKAIMAGRRAQIAQDQAQATGDLNQALIDKDVLIQTRNQTQAENRQLQGVLRRIAVGARTKKGQTFDELLEVYDDLEMVAGANPTVADPALQSVEMQLNRVADGLHSAHAMEMTDAHVAQVMKDAKNGKLGNVMYTTLGSGWKALHNGPLQAGDTVFSAELARQMKNLYKMVDEPIWVGRALNQLTNLFKTYATLSPGFHVRNGLSAIFMNTADDVSLKAQAQGALTWTKFMRAYRKGLGHEFLEAQTPQMREAIGAVAASGAGGRYGEAGFAEAGSSARKLWQWINSNPVTRGSQHLGEWVEGGVRLGMAIDSIAKGSSGESALQRISRIHFDYAQISKMDKTMKQLIPFWTYYSRNLPLQIQMMYTQPKAYSWFMSAVGQAPPDEEWTPKYWDQPGNFNTGKQLSSGMLYGNFDMPFSRSAEQIADLVQLTQGDWQGTVSQFNPWFVAPAEWMAGQDFFTGANYDKKDPDSYKKLNGILGWMISTLGGVQNQNDPAGRTFTPYTNMIRSVLPMVDRSARMDPTGLIFDVEGQQQKEPMWMSYARWGGAPIRVLTPEQQKAAQRSDLYDRRDNMKLQQAAARYLASRQGN